MDPTLLLGAIGSSLLAPAGLWLWQRFKGRRSELDKMIRATFEQTTQLTGSTDREENRAVFLRAFSTAWAASGLSLTTAVKERAAFLFDTWWTYWEKEEETHARQAAAAAGKRGLKFAAHLEALARKERESIGPDGRIHLEGPTKPGG